ncbi:unnamed protein product [Clonostachys rosea f. rosea IK726]|uniref:Uncharacterized protein n=1 Tax=Clonostachys rosea f. rosea IK726 TaxID=1349383 RepID=A0ACA9U949_BIOOC|nr:unnamed protein product [Clonostachys rosea f. rosea IK726]
MALDRHARKAEGGILHLPDLVIHRICTFFCKHCEPPSLGEEDAPDHLTHRGQATLLNLCRVAKFHYNAQRILYHNVDIQIPNNNLQRPLEVTIGFLTSLRINPHLKNHVKSLSIQDVPWAGPGHCHVRESYDNPPLPESLLNDLRTLSHGLRITLSNVQLEKTNLVETLMQLVFISLRTSPELKLAVRPQSPWKDELFTVWKTLGDHSATLFLTQHLSFILPTMPKCSCHRRLHGLMPHQYVENMAARFLIGQAAQSLRSLACTANDLQDTPHLPQLQDLKLCIQEPAPHLASAMEQLPSLRRLSCEYYGFSWTSVEPPHRLFQALKSCSATLRELKISANKSMVLESQLIQAGLHSLKQFKILPLLGFKALRSFSFDGRIMRRFANSLEQVMPSPDGDELCPVLLPDSLETIHINLDEISQTSDGEFEKPCMDAILHAGKKNLRMVVISSRRRRQHKFTIANLRAGPRGSRQECGWEIAEVHDDERLRLTQEEDFPAWDGC